MKSRHFGYLRWAGAGVAIFGGTVVSAPVVAETRTYTYNARGELTNSSVAGGPANGVQTTTGYDAAGNRTAYQTSGSSVPPAYKVPITVPINGLTTIIVPQ